MRSQPSRSGPAKVAPRARIAFEPRSETWIEAAVAGSGTGIWEWQPDTDRLVWCGRCAELLALPPVSVTTLEEVGRHLPDGEPARLRSLVRDLERRGIPARRFCLDRPVRDADGGSRTLRLRGEVRVGGGGRSTTVVGTLHDVTRQASDLGRLKAAADELTLLLHEVNHRVKNSLQLVGNLLALQAVSCDEPVVRGILEEACARVVTVARIHERMHAAQPGLLVDMAEHLGELVHELRRSLLGPGHPVRVDFDGRPGFRLSAAKAVSLALLLNELVTNCIKHAFPAGGPGAVRVVLRPEGGGWLLEVADDGAGLPAGFDPLRAAGLGLRLVNALAEQTEGTLSFDGRRGLRVRLTLPDAVRPV